MSRRSRPSAIAERPLDHDRQVALEQLPRSVRSAFAALWNLDLAFADAVSTSSDTRLGAIRLAWWRERLDELDEGRGAPAEPRLRAVAGELLARGVSGHQLSELEDAWLPLLEPFPWGEAQAGGLKLRGRILFGIGSHLLGGESEGAERAGELWSLIDGARHCTDRQSRGYLLSEAGALVVGPVPRRVRPLTVVAAVAVPSVSDPASGLARGMAATLHRLTGRVPQL